MVGNSTLRQLQRLNNNGHAYHLSYAIETPCLAANSSQYSSLTEIETDDGGAAALHQLLPLLIKCSQQERWIFWIAPPHMPCAPLLKQAGVNIDRIIVIHPNSIQDRCQVLERSLQSDTCSMILSWSKPLTTQQRQRLQQVAGDSDCKAVLFYSEAHPPQKKYPLALH